MFGVGSVFTILFIFGPFNVYRHQAHHKKFHRESTTQWTILYNKWGKILWFLFYRWICICSDEVQLLQLDAKHSFYYVVHVLLLLLLFFLELTLCMHTCVLCKRFLFSCVSSMDFLFWHCLWLRLSPFTILFYLVCVFVCLLFSFPTSRSILCILIQYFRSSAYVCMHCISLFCILYAADKVLINSMHIRGLSETNLWLPYHM